MQEKRVAQSNTYEEMKDKSRLSKSRKISLYRFVSDLFTRFTSEMKNVKAKIHINFTLYLCYIE